MRRLLSLFVTATLLTAGAGAETVERVAALVNGRALLLSDWNAAARLEGLLEQRPPAETPTARRATLDRLIDRELLRQEMSTAGTAPATAQEIAAQVAQIRRQQPEAEGASDERWAAYLAAYGLDVRDLEDEAARQIEVLRVIDFRLRPMAAPDSAAVERYYNDHYLPQMKQAGSAPRSLEETAASIREILVQQKINELLANWLQVLRAQAEIRIVGSEPPAPSAAP
jgi:hypothetical protein